MVVEKKNRILAMLIAVLVAFAMLPIMTQEAYADVPLDFSKHVNGLKDGKIEIGTTLSVNVEQTIADYTELMEAYMEYGEAYVVLKTYSPSNMRYFDYDSSSGIASLTVTEEIAHVGYKVEVCFDIGNNLFYIPGIDVVEKPAAPPVVEKSANTLALTGKTATVKYKKLKKKTQYLDVSKVISFTDPGQGALAYSLSSVKKGSKSFKKYFKVDTSTGKVTVKKKLKKGTYKMKLTVQAGGDAGHNPSELKTVNIKIKVK